MSIGTQHLNPNPMKQAVQGFSRFSQSRPFLILVSMLAGAWALATFVVMSGQQVRSSDPLTVTLLLLGNLVLLSLLGGVVARRFVGAWAARKDESGASRLRVRIVTLFTMMAVVPALLVAIFATVTFEDSLRNTLSKSVRESLENAVAMADTLASDQGSVMTTDITAMAAELDGRVAELEFNRDRMEQVVFREAFNRLLDEAIVMTGSGRVVVRATLRRGLAGIDQIESGAVERAASGEVVILGQGTDARIRALIRLSRYNDHYLYISRLVDPKIEQYREVALKGKQSIEQLDMERADKQINSILIYMAVALLVLLLAVWLGVLFAEDLTKPIGILANAAEQVRGGDLSVRVTEGAQDDEIGVLARAFNRMTQQIENQRNDLLSANSQLDERRRFTEAVLSGVTVGVLGLDTRGVIELANPSAHTILMRDDRGLLKQHITDVLPELKSLFEKSSNRQVDGYITLELDGQQRNLFARISPELSETGNAGFVVTLDDITNLLSAQRTAAWADVARRIAHEIKNPLTPIQLSAERLNRKYSKEVQTDPEVFSQCTETIVRHVDDIRRMVNEFSDFARMPAPIFGEVDVRELVREAVLLPEVVNPSTDFVVNLPETAVMANCDGRQITQALGNIIKNASESIATRREHEGAAYRGSITLTLSEDSEQIYLRVDDNGIGLPREIRSRLLEPYVTTREKGTGLGLAIVTKVMRDHGGDVSLRDAENGGASILLTFRHQPEIVTSSEENARTVLANGVA